ncbi:MAG: ubiquinol-cytochrome c reductase iron-sulfur subunit [Chitinophagales bacterium]
MKNESRREFLIQAGTIGTCICCMGAMSFLSACGTSKQATASVPDAIETPDAVTIPLTAFGTNNALTYQTKKFEQPFYIEKQSDGSYLALRLHCTHRGCTVKVAPDKLVCPCHGSEFSFHGDVLKGPATSPLVSYPVTVDQQNIVVHFS